MIIDGVEYSEQELNVLREYASRDKPKDIIEWLFGNKNGNKNVNTFLGSLRRF